MGIKTSGFEEAHKKLQRARTVIPDVAGDAVLSHIRDVFSDTLVLVPKETGALQSTGHIDAVSITGPKRSWKIVYGEPGEGEGVIDYAAAVHEILTAKHPSPTQAKFVEQPLMESIPKARRKSATAIRKGIRRAFG